jgi:predicted N-formylglutamate amidohydrolase
MTIPPFQLLRADEEPAFAIHRPAGASAFFFTCDHASRRIPARLGDLGLPESELVRHIAWDIGIEPVARRLADALDGTLVLQRYSRLVIDCNRPPAVAASIPVISERTAIPGNENLNEAERAARVREIFEPYHRAIATELDNRQDAGRPTILIAMHSFTPVYAGVARPWHIGMLYRANGPDTRLAGALLKLLREEKGLVVGDNEPYAVSDQTDYGIPVHAEKRGLPHVGIEIRQDLIAEEKGQREWAERLARLLPRAVELLA